MPPLLIGLEPPEGKSWRDVHERFCQKVRTWQCASGAPFVEYCPVPTRIWSPRGPAWLWDFVDWLWPL
jgi:hypothetical protein